MAVIAPAQRFKMTSSKFTGKCYRNYYVPVVWSKIKTARHLGMTALELNAMLNSRRLPCFTTRDGYVGFFRQDILDWKGWREFCPASEQLLTPQERRHLK